MEKLRIGVTFGRKYEWYAGYIQGLDHHIEIIKLDGALKNQEEIKRCQGIVFTGGEDVHPRFYQKPEYLSLCEPGDVSEKRDEFELQLMALTRQHPIPVLGICRGLQLYNVFTGGTLIPDLPTWGKFNHADKNDGSERLHPIFVDPDSLTARQIGKQRGMVNSLHHQAVDRVGEGLVVSALSEDGVVEALEWLKPAQKNFLCLVQWHPERMEEEHSPFVKSVRKTFVEACQNTVI